MTARPPHHTSLVQTPVVLGTPIRKSFSLSWPFDFIAYSQGRTDHQHTALFEALEELGHSPQPLLSPLSSGTGW